MFDFLAAIGLQFLLIVGVILVSRKYEKTSTYEQNHIRWAKGNFLRLLPAWPFLLVPPFLDTRELSCSVEANSCSDADYMKVLILKYASVILGSILIASLYKVEQEGWRYWWVKAKLFISFAAIFMFFVFMADFSREWTF